MFGFNVESMNRMIGNLSQHCIWSQAERCPCRSVRTGGASQVCQVCFGAGFVWRNPTVCDIGVEGFKADRQYAAWSEVDKGDQVATIPSDSDAYAAGEYDSFTMTDIEQRIDQVLTRGKSDTLRQRAIVSIDSLWAIISNARVEFVQGIDYLLNGHTIVWISTTLPVDGQYSITYIAMPQFYVYRDLVSDRPHGHVSLPRKVHLKSMDNLNRTMVGA